MIMCVLLCYPVSIRIYYQQGVLFLVLFFFLQMVWSPLIRGSVFICLLHIMIHCIPIAEADFKISCCALVLAKVVKFFLHFTLFVV